MKERCRFCGYVGEFVVDGSCNDWYRCQKRQAVQQEVALAMACEYLSSILGSCPFDTFGVEIDCAEGPNLCTNNLAGCWYTYFLQEAQKEMIEKPQEEGQEEREIGRSISRTKAIQIAKDILAQAERERFDFAEEEAKRNQEKE